MTVTVIGGGGWTESRDPVILSLYRHRREDVADLFYARFFLA